MYRVELKEDESKSNNKLKNNRMFLMYRVELKVRKPTFLTSPNGVPNVPCGVERLDAVDGFIRYSAVPNVPCGVESA